MTRTNKTSAWRDGLSAQKKKTLKYAKQYEDFRLRRAEIQQKKNEKRENKLEERRRRDAKIMLVKGNLCKDIQNYGGLRLTEKQVDEQVKKISSETKQREALKCQLQFRMKVMLNSPSLDKKLFYMSEKGKLRSVEELTANLKALMSQLRKDKDVLNKDASSIHNLPLVISNSRLCNEKQRLKSLVEATRKKLKPGPNKPKRKKVEIRLKSVSVVTNPDELVGKRVEHFTFDYEGKEKWYNGTVMCIKPNTESELVIRYDCEDTYCFEYSIFGNELVKLLHLSPPDFLNKKIKQRFIAVESEDWWEIGFVINVEIVYGSPQFTVHFSCSDDEADDFINGEEVITYPPLDDYLNNDVIFM